MSDPVVLSTPPRLKRPITPETPSKQNRHCYALNVDTTPTKVSRLEISVEPLRIRFKSKPNKLRRRA